MKYYAIILIAFIACTPPGNVSVDYDRAIDFKQYQAASIDRMGSSIQSDRIDSVKLMNAIRSTFESKGLFFSNSSNLQVRVVLYEKNKEQVVETIFYPEYPRAEKHTEGYIKGALSLESKKKIVYNEEWCIVSLIDPLKKKIVWEGGYVIKQDINNTSKYLTSQSIKSLKAVIREYPPEQNP